MARLLSMPGSGSVKHPSAFVAALGLSPVLRRRRGFQVFDCAGRLLALLTLGNFVSWVGGSLGGRPLGLPGPYSVRGPPLYFFRPESRQDYPPNLSILISGGKENNRDALSNGE